MKSGCVVRNGHALIPKVWLADTAWDRMRGLLGHRRLEPHGQEALWLEPCNNVHTIGMRYPLDIVFLDRIGRVIDCCENVRPNRMRLCCRARHTIELAVGGIAALTVAVGDVWQWHAESEA